jgi:hypothetical protein
MEPLIAGASWTDVPGRSAAFLVNIGRGHNGAKRTRMTQQHFPANREIEMAVLALQVFQVLFLWVHDWIPLGRLTMSQQYAARIRHAVSSQ